MNTFGNLLRLTTFGESHGTAIGAILDGLPAGLLIDETALQLELDRRRPGQSRLASQRRESDTVQILSGLFEGRTTGAPIGVFIANEDAKSKDYDHLRDVYRPSHADYTYDAKYGHRDHRGGGRSSARETALRVAAGAIVRQWLTPKGIAVNAWVQSIGPVSLTNEIEPDKLETRWQNLVYCPDAQMASQMEDAIEVARKDGDSLGGIIEFSATGLPPGLGEPVYGKLHAQIGAAMLGINAVKGVEFGGGFAMSQKRGSEVNDLFTNASGTVATQTNNSGGIQGGISNGMPITGRVAFKPTATIMQAQSTLDTQGQPATAEGRGRHDPCVVPRAVPIVEAMLCLVIADMYLLNQARK